MARLESSLSSIATITARNQDVETKSEKGKKEKGIGKIKVKKGGCKWGEIQK